MFLSPLLKQLTWSSANPLVASLKVEMACFKTSSGLSKLINNLRNTSTHEQKKPESFSTLAFADYIRSQWLQPTYIPVIYCLKRRSNSAHTTS